MATRKTDFWRADLIEALRRMFDESANTTFTDALAFLFGVASIACLAESLVLLVGALAAAVGGTTGADTTLGRELTYVGLYFTGAVVTLIVAWGLLFWRIKARKTRPVNYELRLPTAAEGVVFMLSTFDVRHTQFYAELGRAVPSDTRDPAPGLAALGAELDRLTNRWNRLVDTSDPWPDDSTDALEKALRHTNWGTLAEAVLHHHRAGSLRYFSFLGTPDEKNSDGTNRPGSGGQVEMARQVVRALTRRADGTEVVPADTYVEIDAYRMDRTAEAIARLFREIEAGANGLAPDAVVADITGGTAAMTGGLVLAAREQGFRLEYHRQDDGKPGPLVEVTASPRRT